MKWSATQPLRAVIEKLSCPVVLGYLSVWLDDFWVSLSCCRVQKWDSRELELNNGPSLGYPQRIGSN